MNDVQTLDSVVEAAVRKPSFWQRTAPIFGRAVSSALLASFFIGIGTGCVGSYKAKERKPAKDNNPTLQVEVKYHERFDYLDAPFLKSAGIEAELANSYDARFNALDIIDLVKNNISNDIAVGYDKRFRGWDIVHLVNERISNEAAVGYDSRFNVFDIVEFVKADVSNEAAVGYDSRFNVFDIVDFVKAGISNDIAAGYGQRFNGTEIALMVKTGVSAEAANAYSVRFNAVDIVRLFSGGIDGETANQYSEIQEMTGEDLAKCAVRGIPIQYVQSHSSKNFRQISEDYIREKLDDEELKVLKDKFDITFLHRYSPELCRELVRNLDPDYNSSKPVALVVLNKNDHNGAFESGFSMYTSLASRYKLFIYEANEEDDVFRAVRTVGSHHGLDNNGDPLKPIELLLLGGHGSQTSLNLGATPEDDIGKYEIRYLDTGDAEQFADVSRYVRGTVILVSCSTGNGGNGVGNLARIMFDSLRNVVTLFAPMVPTFTDSITFDPGAKPVYGCGPKSTLTLRRKSK